MRIRNPRSVRRALLERLYACYMADPHDMLTPEDFLQDNDLAREDLMPNMHYLSDSGLVEMMLSFRPPMFAAVRIRPGGIDLVENYAEFNLRFPPALEDSSDAAARLPLLIERLIEEADLSSLDGEARKSLLRDVQFLREEVARPPKRWRMRVVDAVLYWISDNFAEPAEALPSLPAIQEAIREAKEQL